MRLYFTGIKDIPDKEIDIIDEWAIKTKTRKYLVWGASGLAAIALISLTPNPSPKERGGSTVTGVAEIEITDANLTPDPSPQERGESSVTDTTETSVIPETPEILETAVVETVVKPVVLNVTHNAFRGDNSNGISAAKNVPVKWNLSAGTNIAWKFETPRKGNNSPVINGNRVFFTGADKEVRELYCYDLTTGKKLWSLEATNIPGSPAKPPETMEDTGLAASTVATNGKQICAIFGTGDLICADMNGNRLWAKNIGVPDNHYGYSASLLTFGDLLFVQFDDRKTSKVIAFDLLTGLERWNKNRPDKLSWSSPIIAYVNNTPQLVLMGSPSLTAYNPNNGAQLWRVEGLSGEPGASACSADGIVYTSGDHSKFVAVNAADGTVLWEKNDFLTEVSSPVATKDNIYMATTYGLVVSFDTQTGDPRVEHELGTVFYSSPMIADGKVFLFSTNGKVFIFTADDEFKLLDSFETGEETFATPAFADEKIVVRTETSIYCVVK
jgi:outer membrane protein assembly factor BamB